MRLIGTIILGHSGPRSNDNKEVLQMPQHQIQFSGGGGLTPSHSEYSQYILNFCQQGIQIKYMSIDKSIWHFLKL